MMIHNKLKVVGGGHLFDTDHMYSACRLFAAMPSLWSDRPYLFCSLIPMILPSSVSPWLSQDTSKLPPNLRLGVMPVLGTMPAIFGDAMAAFVLCELAEQPILPTPVEGLGRHIKHRYRFHSQALKE